MSDSDEGRPSSQASRRLWHGGFGAFIGGILGLIVAGSVQANLLDGVFYGALAGFLLGIFLGLDVIAAVIYLWPG